MAHQIHAHLVCLVLFTCLVACHRQVESDAEERFEREGEDYFQRFPQAPGILIHDETIYISRNISKNTARILPSASDSTALPLPQIFRVPWWASFIGSLVHFFYRQRVPNRSQFGVIYMANVNNLNQFPTYFIPQTPNGHPIINNNNVYSPPNANNFNNYVAARPMQVGQTMVHAERTLLSQLDALWDSYVRFYGFAPNIIVLYSWIMPCPNCTNMIIQYLTQPRYANVEYRVVAYTAEGTSAQANLSYMTPEGNRRSRASLIANNIFYWRHRCDRPPGARATADVMELQGSSNPHVKLTSASNQQCKLTDTLQGCLVDCLGHDFCCTCKESGKKSMVAAMVNNLTKDCGTSDLEVCAKSWIENALSGPRSGASSCGFSAQERVIPCVRKCVGRPLSKPLNPKTPTLHPGILSEYSDIFNIAPVDLTSFCQDIRTEGVLCNRFSSDSFTAGNTLCRNGTKCDFRGELYKWCYVDFNNNGWDYCCTSSCGFAQNTKYMWCESGNQWQYCGDAGSITVKKQRCLSEYPCGMHQERGKADFYWCYIDAVRSWEYCCQPQDTCSKKGKEHDWCWTGKENKTVSIYCQP